MSVVSQNFKEWELLLVDDGSSDNPYDIIAEIIEKDNRIKFFPIKHGGLSSARNHGIELARGEFLFFLDSDDLILPGALSHLHKFILECKADMIEGKIVRNMPASLHKNITVKTFDSLSAIEKSLYQSGVTSSVCGKLFHRKVWHDLRFRENILYEDLDIFYKILEKCNKILVSNFPVYYYRKRNDSILSSWDIKRNDVRNITARIAGYYENNIRLHKAAKERSFSANFNMFILNTRNEFDKEAEDCWRLIKQLRKDTLFNSKTRLKSKIGAMISFLGRNVCRFLVRTFL